MADEKTEPGQNPAVSLPPDNPFPLPLAPPRNLGGRPKGSKDKVPRVSPQRRQNFRELYDNEVEKNAPRIIRAAIRAATRGDSRALVDVLNRVLGPPTQRVEMTGPGGAPLALQAAAPVALALMSTEELRALLGLQARLGLPDVQVQAIRDAVEDRRRFASASLLPPAAEPGHSSASPLLPPLLLDSTLPSAPQPASLVPADAPQPACYDEASQADQNPEPVEQADEQGAGGPECASPLSDASGRMAPGAGPGCAPETQESGGESASDSSAGGVHNAGNVLPLAGGIGATCALSTSYKHVAMSEQDSGSDNGSFVNHAPEPQDRQPGLAVEGGGEGLGLEELA